MSCELTPDAFKNSERRIHTASTFPSRQGVADRLRSGACRREFRSNSTSAVKDGPGDNRPAAERARRR